MTVNNVNIHTVHCNNEYDSLNYVIAAPPDYMKITSIINETQSHYAKTNIDIETAIREHKNFINVLKNNGAELTYLSTSPDLNEQVFTRDIGFAIQDKFFLSNMNHPIRKRETELLNDCLNENRLAFIPFEDSNIEGGDVIVDNDLVWVGISERTEESSLELLKSHLPHHEVTPIHLSLDILHLDCVFNILEGRNALIYPDGMDQTSFDILRRHYHLIEITEEEKFQMGPNVLSIGDKKVISMPENRRINEKLRTLGYEVIEVSFSEIIKSGGSFRCCSLPLNRG